MARTLAMEPQRPRAVRRSERDVVVGDLEVAFGRRTTGIAALARAAAPAPARAALAAGAEQDQPRLRPAHLDLGHVLLVPVLVRPLVVVDGALEVDLLALLAVVTHHLRGLAEDLDLVPLRALLLVAVLARPLLGGGEGEVGDGLAGLGVPDLRVLAEVADENDSVDAGHGLLFGRGDAAGYCG